MSKITVILLVFVFIVSCALAATAPHQPFTDKPGGSAYLFSGVKKSLFGEAGMQYWIFEPDKPKPEKAPLIVFNHGWGATDPKTYEAWIEHIVRRGNIVIYPVYQDPGKFRFPPEKITPNAIAAVKDAIERMQNDPQGFVQPETDKFAIVGHSAGGQITANMAALSATSGLPVPRAVMCVEPGKSWARSSKVKIPLEDVSKIPSGTLLLTVTGDQDKIVKDIDAKYIFNGAKQVSTEDKNFIILVSDSHGSPALKADHFAPAARKDIDIPEKKEARLRSADREARFPRLREKMRERISSRDEDADEENEFKITGNGSKLPDALDYYGFWKLFDGLYSAAFYGKYRDYALGNTPGQRFMGTWSDGVPVKELIVKDSP